MKTLTDPRERAAWWRYQSAEHLSALTESELRRAESRADAERSAVCDAMIAAGRGHETSAETLALARRPDADPLTLRFAAASAECGAVVDEKRRRMEWHGSLRRVVRKDVPAHWGD